MESGQGIRGQNAVLVSGINIVLHVIITNTRLKERIRVQEWPRQFALRLDLLMLGFIFFIEIHCGEKCRGLSPH